MEKPTGRAQTWYQVVCPGTGLWDAGVQEISSDWHPLGPTLPQVTVSKAYKGPFPNLVFVLFWGTAFFKVPSAWNLEDSGQPLTADDQPLASDHGPKTHSLVPESSGFLGVFLLNLK